MNTLLISALALLVSAQVHVENGVADEGEEVFRKLRCDICHSVNGKPPNAPYPIRNLSRQSAEEVARIIVERSEAHPGAKFDEMAMASAASRLTRHQLPDVAAYLRRK